MFTLEQVKAIHDEAGKASTLAAYLRALRDIGVEKWVFDTHALTITYYDKAGNELLKEDIK